MREGTTNTELFFLGPKIWITFLNFWGFFLSQQKTCQTVSECVSYHNQRITLCNTTQWVVILLPAITILLYVNSSLHHIHLKC